MTPAPTNPLPDLPQGASIYIYGTGSAGESLLAWLSVCRPDLGVLGFIDRERKGQLHGLPVTPLHRWQRRHAPYARILIASAHQKEIAAELNRRGIRDHQGVSVPSYLMKEILPAPARERLLPPLIHAITRLLPRRYHLFFGEHGGKFIGNNKYYFLHLWNQGRRDIHWLVEDRRIERELIDAGLPVTRYPSPRALRLIFTASHLYFDNMTWQRSHPWLRFVGARIIHMSHGVGLKLTEKMLIPQTFLERLTDEQAARLDERIFSNDLLISTSPFYAREVSSPAYNTPMDKIACTGYPKNDLFYRDIPGNELFADRPTLSLIDRHRAGGGKVIVYAPTFRDHAGSYRFATALSHRELDDYLRDNTMLLVIKGHTSALGGDADAIRNLDNILLYENDHDGYPLLARADLLITDYSSIYMDYLHTGRPVLFFPFDYEEYHRDHRTLQFDYEEMTPGPKAHDQKELIEWIEHFLVLGNDGYEDWRRRIFEQAFSHADGEASERVSQAIRRIAPSPAPRA